MTGRWVQEDKMCLSGSFELESSHMSVDNLQPVSGFINFNYYYHSMWCCAWCSPNGEYIMLCSQIEVAEESSIHTCPNYFCLGQFVGTRA